MVLEEQGAKSVEQCVFATTIQSCSIVTTRHEQTAQVAGVWLQRVHCIGRGRVRQVDPVCTGVYKYSGLHNCELSCLSCTAGWPMRLGLTHGSLLTALPTAVKGMCAWQLCKLRDLPRHCMMFIERPCARRLSVPPSPHAPWPHWVLPQAGRGPLPCAQRRRDVCQRRPDSPSPPVQPRAPCQQHRRRGRRRCSRARCAPRGCWPACRRGPWCASPARRTPARPPPARRARRAHRLLARLHAHRTAQYHKTPCAPVVWRSPSCTVPAKEQDSSVLGRPSPHGLVVPATHARRTLVEACGQRRGPCARGLARRRHARDPHSALAHLRLQRRHLVRCRTEALRRLAASTAFSCLMRGPGCSHSKVAYASHKSIAMGTNILICLFPTRGRGGPASSSLQTCRVRTPERLYTG
jgi:hypothetical protein